MAPQPPPRKILFLAANPKDTSRLRLDEEIRNIQEGLKLSTGRDNFELIAQWAVRPQDLRRALLEHAPKIVHFSGHGAGEPGLILENELGQAQTMSSAVLANLFKLCPSVDCVVLNACYSEVQATAIADHIPYVIGMNQAIGDNIAINFAVGFYDALGYGRPIPEAYEFGMTAIEAEPSIITRSMSAYPETADVVMPNPTIPILIQSERLPQPVRSPVTLSKKEYRDRTALLNKVKSYWIKGVLERSLHNQILIELGLEERLDFADPFNMALGMVNQPQQTLALGTQAIDVFDALGEGRSLLILGEPGSGKTITLLQLTRELLIRAEQDASHLIPVVFNLSSWKQGLSLSAWLVNELNTKYQVPKAIGEPWVKQQQLLLMLDGLDEVQACDREACVDAINHFQRTDGTEMVVCSRIKDYKRLPRYLNFQDAIYLKPLIPEQIHRYFDQFSNQLHDLRKLLASDTALQDLAQSPLMLNLMVLAYSNLPTEHLPKKTQVEDHKRQLFDVYIRRMLSHRIAQKKYENLQIIQWLSWLSKSMITQSKTVFLIERMDHSWLQNKHQRLFYMFPSQIMTGILYALIFGASVALDYGLSQGLQIGIISGLFGLFCYLPSNWAMVVFKKESLNNRRKSFFRWIFSIETGVTIGLTLGFVIGVSVGLRAGSVTGATIGFASGLFIAFLSGLADYVAGGNFIQRFTNPVESLRWSWFDVKNKLIFWLIVFVVIGVIFQIFKVLDDQPPLIVTLFLLLIALIAGLFDGLSSAAEVETKTSPNQGIKQSAKTSLTVSLLGCIALTLAAKALGIPMFLGAILGLLIGWYLGGTACVLHCGLRITFCCNRCMPWNYARFLDTAVEYGFLQKVGGGYIFIHRSLMEHFAQLKSSS